MRLSVTALAVLMAVPAGAAPTEDWSARIAADGLSRTEAALAGLADPTSDDTFALGAVQFLAGIEQALQLRWSVGATGELAPLPVLRVSLPDNPAPAPFRASLVSEVFQGLLTRMDQSVGTLSAIGDDTEIGLTVRLDDLWFDIDANGTRSAAEGLLPIAMSALLNPWDRPDPTRPPPVVRFDTADAAWLSAYAHLISALSEFVLAFDPTAATERMLSAAADKTTRLGPGPSLLDQWLVSTEFDKAMVAVLALRQQPDARRTRAAKAHLLAMIAENRKFWARVVREKDNAAEWIPNDRQKGAFGIRLPPNTGATWMGVLADLQALLDGTLLVPHWALPPGSGIDIGAFLEKPAPIDLIGWAHGIDALPFARQGPVISAQNWNAFGAIVGGDSLLYALYLN